MARKGALALYELQHEEMPYHDGWRSSWAKKRSASHPFHWSDGLSVGVSPVDVDPDGEWLPVVAAEQSDSDDEQAAEGE